MASNEKKQRKEWEKFAKQTDKFLGEYEERKARTFKGLPDRIVNVVITVVTTAFILAASYLDFANFLIDIVPTELFTVKNGVLDTVKNWGIILAVLAGSTVLSTNAMKLPKFIKTITSRAGLVASVAVLISLPGYVEGGVMNRPVMLVVAFGFILYSCFSSRSNMTNLSLGKASLSAGAKIKGLKDLVSAYTKGKGNLKKIKKEFKKAQKKLSGSGSTSNLVIILWSLVITILWVYGIEFLSIELVSSVAVLALTTVLELVEAFKGPSEKNNVTETVGKNEITSIYNEIKNFAMRKAA